MPSVFISYAQSDKRDASRLFDSLHKANVKVLLDREITADRSISSMLKEAIAQSNAVIVLVSPRALENHWVLFEIGAAEALNKKIIPVLLSGDHLKNEMPDILRNLHWIDARHTPHLEVVEQIRIAVAAPSDSR